MNEHECIQTAYKTLKNIDDAKSLKMHFATVNEYYTAINTFNELYKFGRAHTFQSGVAKFFDKHGFVVTNSDVNYIIEVA